MILILLCFYRQCLRTIFNVLLMAQVGPSRELNWPIAAILRSYSNSGTLGKNLF